MDLDWLLGFIEAKGTFTIPKHTEKLKKIPRPRFTINARKKFKGDLENIFIFLERMNLDPRPGVIENSENVRLEIKDSIKKNYRCLDLYKFLRKLPWRTTKKRKFLSWGKEIHRIYHLEDEFKEDLSEPQPITINWLLGFIEAKGSFFISAKTGKFKINQFRPGFNLLLKSEEKELLDEIRKYFNDRKIQSYDLRPINKGKSLRLEIKGLENCLKLYEFLSRLKWQTVKENNFLRWGQVLSRLKEGEMTEIESYLMFIHCQRIN
ncbi:MAG: LAGLIDADG family homing endonuclease [Candidatus Helarchaeota archaeon]